jgi:hypothetical protein
MQDSTRAAVTRARMTEVLPRFLFVTLGGCREKSSVLASGKGH